MDWGKFDELLSEVRNGINSLQDTGRVLRDGVMVEGVALTTTQKTAIIKAAKERVVNVDVVWTEFKALIGGA